MRGGRIRDICFTLMDAPRLQVLHILGALSDQQGGLVNTVIRNPSVTTSYTKTPVRLDHCTDFVAVWGSDTRFRSVVHFPLPGPWATRQYASMDTIDVYVLVFLVENSQVLNPMSIKVTAGLFLLGMYFRAEVIP
jgi:hypothetical protein